MMRNRRESCGQELPSDWREETGKKKNPVKSGIKNLKKHTRFVIILARRLVTLELGCCG